ncbi:MAG TPA: YraN family protein [Candidatus Saccharimonadia bacterium]|jgi:putative endonuclease|nr:YraN family protein [Candidatus Saccharimonadia bacterium]
MITTVAGRLAETKAAAFLENQGFEIIGRNWRNRWCELDIIARHGGQLHIVEVKYRRRLDWGSGFEYITPDKIARLKRAALAWTWAHHYTGAYQIDVVAVTGELGSPQIEHRPGVIF